MSNGTSEISARSTSGEVGRVERRLARVAAEQLDHADALVRPDRGAEVGDGVHRPRHRRREADAVVGPEHVVVHRLRDGDDAEVLLVQAGGEAERVVAADRDQRLEAQVVEDAQDVARAVDAAVGPRHAVLLRARTAGTSSGFMLLGFVREVCRIVPPVRSKVRTRSGGSAIVQSASRCRIVGVDLQEAQPAAPQADDLDVVVAGANRPRP